MPRKTFAWSVLVAVLPWVAVAHAQGPSMLYPGMAPLEQYLMDRDAEVALARSGAPASISGGATVLVLGPRGYETAVEGKNGFVCGVERSWMSPFGDRQFWNPRERSPICYNPVAARCVVPLVKLRTTLALAGLSVEEIARRIKAAYAEKQFPPLEPGAMAYMMGKEGYLNDAPIMDDGAHNLAHLMFYAPAADSSAWGADLPGSPVYRGPVYAAFEPNVFIVLTGAWSDGTPASRRFHDGD